MKTNHREALKWLADRGGDGIITKNGQMLARGDWSAYKATTWQALEQAGFICKTAANRWTITDDGLKALR